LGTGEERRSGGSGSSLSAQHDHAQDEGAKGGRNDTNHQIGSHRNSPFPAHAVSAGQTCYWQESGRLAASPAHDDEANDNHSKSQCDNAHDHG
jgi:hypothetical protein